MIPNGSKLSLENAHLDGHWKEPLKTVHFGKIYNFLYDHSEAGCLLKMLILLQICSFYQWNDSQLILISIGQRSVHFL